MNTYDRVWIISAFTTMILLILDTPPLLVLGSWILTVGIFWVAHKHGNIIEEGKKVRRK